jgi:hypothetical protein
MFARIAVAVAAAVLLPAASAQKAPQQFDPGGVYICPHQSDTGLDCYLDAVVHLYTMCKHVKSIEIIEFGHAQAQEGVNGAKSEYCVDKQRINITRPYQAALREATPWHDAVEHLRELQAYWLASMNNLKWRNGEAPQDYDDRVNRVYDELSWRIEEVRVSFQTATDAQAAKVVPVKAKPAAKAKGAATKQN